MSGDIIDFMGYIFHVHDRSWPVCQDGDICHIWVYVCVHVYACRLACVNVMCAFHMCRSMRCSWPVFRVGFISYQYYCLCL